MRASAPGLGREQALQAHEHAAQVRDLGSVAALEQLVLDVVDAIGRPAHDDLQFVGLVLQQVVEERHGGAQALTPLDGHAQAVDGAQRLAPCREHAARVHVDP